MASGKEIKKRIRSVGNTKKITKTMEMVATAKSKKALNRVVAARPYAENLDELVGSLGESGQQDQNPYFRKSEAPKKKALLIITANRGLCGGYIANVCKMGLKYLKDQQAAGVEVELSVFWKKRSYILRI